MTAAVPDPSFRDQLAETECARCGHPVSWHDDQGACQDFDPCEVCTGRDAFRDQLAEESGKHRPNYTGEPWPWGDGATYAGCVCGWLCEDGASFEQHRADALLPLVAAEVDARAAALVERRADAPASPATAHRMLPGSHERSGGPECICGAEWSPWNSTCTRALAGPHTTDEEADRG